MRVKGLLLLLAQDPSPRRWGVLTEALQRSQGA